MFPNAFALLLAFLRDAFTENVGLKALSLAFAIGFFAYRHGAQDLQQRTVPVDLVTLPPEDGDRVLMTQVPPNVHVTLRGPTRSIDYLVRTGVTPVEIDLRKERKKRIEFSPTMFALPSDIDVVIIDPPRIDLVWQDVVTRKIPLQAAVTGQPAQGYVVKAEPQLEPKSILAQGPASVVEVMQYARLSAFDVTGLTDGVYTRRIAIDAPPNRVSYIGPENASVTVTIARRMSEAKFTDLPVEVVGVGTGFVTPRSVDVTVIGPPEVVRALRPEQIVPRADLSSVKGLDLKEQKHGSVSVKLSIELAKAEAEIQPPSVTVRW